MTFLRNTSIGLALLLAAGCASYYQITDPTTGKVYFAASNGMEESGSGALIFTDARSGDKVTIQNSQMAKISEQQYENARSGAATQPWIP